MFTRAGVTGRCDILFTPMQHGFWDSNFGPLINKYMLLSAEPSHQRQNNLASLAPKGKTTTKNPPQHISLTVTVK